MEKSFKGCKVMGIRVGGDGLLFSRMPPLVVFLAEGKHKLLSESNQAVWDSSLPTVLGKGPPSPALPTAGRHGPPHAAVLV